MKVKVTRQAMKDIMAGRQFYEKQQVGIGDYFFDSLFAEIDALADFAGIHSVHFGFYRLLCKRFPYAVYYKIISDEATVFRVLDCRRNPKHLQKNLESSH